MKTLKEIFVIVRPHSIHGFIQDFISINKDEIELKCSQLNEEANKKWKEKHDKKQVKAKIKKEFSPTVIFQVRDLAKAIEEHSDFEFDYYSAQNASY